MKNISGNNKKARVLDIDKRQRLTQTFIDLVTIDSPTGDEVEIGKYLLNSLILKGVEAKMDSKGNVFGQTDGVGEPLLFSGHMDTVMPGRGVHPEVSKGEIKSSKDTILGADNKSTLASILEVIERLKEDGIPHRSLDILFTVDEESTNTGAIEFDYKLLRAKKGIISDIAKPIGTIVLASPAYVRFDVTLLGKAGHASLPEKAQSVIVGLGEILAQVKLGYVDELTTVNIGFVETGTVRNTIPGSAIIQGEIRSYDDEHMKQHVAKTLDLFRQIARAKGLKIKLSQKQDNPGYIFDQEDPYVKEIAETLKSLGIKPMYVKSPSCSDANIFNSIPGLQVINIGDAAHNTHTVDEFIRITDMEKQVKIFCALATIGIDRA